MGNKPFRVALKLEQNQYVAGDVVRGSVYLSVDKQSSLRGVEGIYLLFEGVEHAQVSHHHRTHDPPQQDHTRRGSSAGSSSRRPVDRSSETIVRSDHPVVLASQLRVGKFEYPFQWRLPFDLPTSMRCAKKDSSNFAEIRYSLTAYLATITTAGSRRSSTGSTLPRADVPITITARHRPSVSGNAPLIAESEKFPVNTCMFWNNGHIAMGWQADVATASPDGSVSVQVCGENRSPLAVKHLTVKWKETVTWAADSSSLGHRKSVTRTLVEQQLAVDGLRCWQPWYKPSQGRPTGTADQYCAARLKLPADARDTYSGRLVQVRHVLVVEAHTKSLWTSAPELSRQVRIARSGPGVTDSEQHRDVLATAWPAENPMQIPEAQLITTNWGPVVGDAVAIPEAQIVMLDEELTAGQDRGAAAWDDSAVLIGTDASDPVVASVAIEPSAPDESLVASLDYDVPDEQQLATDPSATPPHLEQLRLLVRNSPEILEAALQDPTWSSFAKSLSPRDFSAVILQAGGQASTVARTLARSMHPKLECRHLLACIWSLPDSQRLEVLQQTACWTSDLSRNQNLLEQELSHSEVIVFRQALQASG